MAFFRDPRIGGSTAQACVFNTIKGYYQQYGNVPDAAVVLVEVKRVLERFSRHKDKSERLLGEVHRILGVTKLVTDKSEPLARKAVAHILDTCVHKDAVEEEIDLYRESGDLAALRTRLTEIESKRAASSGGGLSITGLLGLELGDVGQRVSTNIPWLDSRFGHGLGPVLGCTMGIIAPQGHGKTSLGVQLAVSQAIAGRHALLVLAEEGMSLSMTSKIFACALGIPYPMIADSAGADGKQPKVLAERVEAAIKASGVDPLLAQRKLAMLERHLHVMDLVARGITPEIAHMIEAELQSLRAQNSAPVYTYVDWAGKIVESIISQSGNTKEHELKALTSTLSTAAQRSNSIIAISQQMAPAVVKKGPYAINDMYCAADCRAFTETCKYAFVINPRDPRTRFSIMRVPKTRDDPQGDYLILHLRGELSSFHDMTDDWEIQGKRMLKRGKSRSDSAMPAENRRRGRPPRTDEIMTED